MAHADVVEVLAHGQRHVARQRPRRGGPGEEELVGVHGLQAYENRGFVDGAVAVGHLVARQRRGADRAVRHDLMAAVQQVRRVEALQDRPHRLDILVGVGDVRLLEVDPVAEHLGELVPLRLARPHALATLVVEGAQAVVQDRLRALDAQFLLHRPLDRQAVRIPTGLPQHAVPGHGLVATDDVLAKARHDVVHARLAVGRGRALVEDPVRVAFALLDAAAEGVVILPPRVDAAFGLGVVERTRRGRVQLCHVRDRFFRVGGGRAI